MKQALQVRFQKVREIRMGSPYNLCEIKFEGEWIPPLPKEDGQNLKAHSPDHRYLALVQWNTTNNRNRSQHLKFNLAITIVGVV